MWRSLPHTPQWLTSTSTSPAPGRGTGLCSTTRSPFPRYTAAGITALSAEPGRPRRLGTETVAQRQGDQDAEQEASNVRHPRHTRAGAGEELQDEPEPQEPHGGDVAYQGDDDDDEQRAYRDSWEQHQIGAHHPGDGARRADDRNRAVGLEGELGGGGDDPGNQIEDRVADPAHAVIDVVAEDP